MSARFVVCAYYTDDYAEHAARLEASVRALGLPFHAERVDSAGSWQANTALKPAFIARCLDRFPDRDIVYLDADCRLMRYPALFETLEGDVGIFFTPRRSWLAYKLRRLFGGKKEKRFSHRVLTGTLFLRNNARVRRFVQDWIRAQERLADKVDQDSIEAVIDTAGELRFTPLPFEYVKIHDHAAVGEPVIEHYQASREANRSARAAQRRRRGLRRRALGLLVLAGLVLLLVLALR